MTTGKPENAHGRTADRVVRKRLADGTVKEYRYPAKPRRPRRLPREKGAIRLLAEQYVTSPEFRRLSVKWQAVKRYYLGILEDELGWMTVDDLNSRDSRGDFYQLRDGFAATPDKADKLIDTLKGLLSWGYERNRLAYNHALGIPHLAKSGKRRNEIVWTEDQEALVYAAFPASLVQAFRFALFSGMRQSDMCALRWSDLKDGWLSCQPSKTRKTTGIWVHLPIFALPPFQDLLDSLSRATDFILTTETGHPMEAENLRVRWRTAAARTPLAAMDLHWHDLRGTTATRLLEASCTDAEVAAITGHAIGQGSKLGDYAARSRQLALNAYRKWAAHLATGPQVVALDNRMRKS